MLTAPQLRAARALLGIDQRKLAELSGVSLPTIQRMEGSTGLVRGSIGTLTKIVEAFEQQGVELIRARITSQDGGAGVRFKASRGAFRVRDDVFCGTSMNETRSAGSIGRIPPASPGATKFELP